MLKLTPTASGQHKPLLALVICLAIVGAVLAIFFLDYFAGDFANNLWGPARYLVQGRSPYQSQELLQANHPLWLPPAIGLFFPLGWLPLRQAANLWLLGNLALVAVLLGWRRQGGGGPLTAALLAAAFPPLLIHLWLGQYTLLATVLFLLSARLVTQRRFFLAGLAIVPVLAKPQLAVLALPGLWLATMRVGGRRGALLFPAAALLGTALLTVPLWIAHPAWLPDLLLAQQANPDWLQPTLYAVLPRALGPAGWAIAAAVGLAALGLNLWLWRRRPAEEAMPWSLALTTVATPYLWSWDVVLFLPLIVHTVQPAAGRGPRVLWGVGYLFLWGTLVATWLLVPESSDYHNFGMPWLLWLLVLVSQKQRVTCNV